MHNLSILVIPIVDVIFIVEYVDAGIIGKILDDSNERIIRLKQQVQEYERGICTERALLWTEYFKKRKNRQKPVIVQMAEALRHVLLNKSVIIYPDELIVGNYTSKRVGGIIYPESHGVVVLLDLLKFPRRAVNPLRISRKEQLKLAMILPFWQNRFIIAKAFPNLFDRIRYSLEQLRAKDYFIYEVGGIAHLTPDHAKLIALGTDGIKKEIEDLRKLKYRSGKRCLLSGRLNISGGAGILRRALCRLRGITCRRRER